MIKKLGSIDQFMTHWSNVRASLRQKCTDTRNKIDKCKLIYFFKKLTIYKLILKTAQLVDEESEDGEEDVLELVDEDEDAYEREFDGHGDGDGNGEFLNRTFSNFSIKDN